MTKSYSGLSDKLIKKHEEDFFRIVCTIDTAELDEVVVKFKPGKKKEVLFNGKAYDKYAEHIGKFPVVMISPDDIKIIIDTSEVRRKFMDNVLCQEDKHYLQYLISYNRILKQRNAALKEMADANQINEELLKIYDKQLIPQAIEINKKRGNFLLEFVPVLKAIYLVISGGQELVDCSYKSSLNENDYNESLLKNRQKDFYLGYTASGIHRDDLVFEFEGKPLKKFASQGQRKTFLLAVKLAQYEFLRRSKKVKPILLLDDIFDKLDSKRVDSLIKLLVEETFGQVFITDTHESRVEDLLKNTSLTFSKYKVEEGRIFVQNEAQ